MKLSSTKIQLLEEHLDLLPTPKRELARWLCKYGNDPEAKMPNQLWQIAHHSFPFHPQVHSRESLVRRLTLDLLSKNKLEISRRIKVGASRHKPAKPVLVHDD